MPTYQRPLKPWDPVIPDQKLEGPSRYLRDNFQGSGQDSHTQAPAQDPVMWQALTNAMPITKGVIERRWGYTQFATPTAAKRLFNFQRDSDGLRVILATGGTAPQAFTELGASYNSSIYTVSNINAILRQLTSRSYSYFYNGNTPDAKKWDGNNAGGGAGVTNWGINSADVTVNVAGGGTGNTSYGPNAPTIAGLGGGAAWTNPNNIKVQDGAVATITLTPPVGGNVQSGHLQGTGFGFSTTGIAIVGIQVDVKLACDHPAGRYSLANMTAKLLKNGFVYGTGKNNGNLPDNVSGLAFITYGGPTDLWGGTWATGDVNASNFGIDLQAFWGDDFNQDPSTFNVDFVRITIYVNPNTGSSTNSGNGVGVVSIVPQANAITLNIGRVYYLVPKNSTTGHYGDLSNASNSTGPITTSSKVNLVLATYNDPQVDYKAILATADGGDPSVLYLVAEVTNTTTTYSDVTPDTTLVLNQAFLFTDQLGNSFGVALNDPPPAGNLAIKHQGRLWMSSGQNVFFSKAVAELTLPNGFIAGKYEECWPGSNYFDVSEGAETISGLLSDGTTLYIGTQSHVRRLMGNTPANFQQPQIVHPQTGVLNQECWQIVYTQGTPSGSIWMTPDYRIIQSDFNTYMDIGAPIQDILNGLKSTAPSLVHASFVATGEYDLYIIAVPSTQTTYCDLHLVYDMRHQKWFVWQPTNGSLALLYNITAAGGTQWLFLQGTTGTAINRYQPTALTDNGTGFTVSAKTSWMGLVEPTQRKILNEVEVSGDNQMLLSVSGALTAADFLVPKVIITNQPLVLGPLGTLKFFIAALGSDRYKNYQFTFASSSTLTPIMLNSYNIEVIPLSDI